MKSVNQLNDDVKWWERELEIRKRKLEDAKRIVQTGEPDVREAEQKLEERKRELAEAKRLEEQQKSKP